MDELYRGCRISVKQADQWIARVTHVRGQRVPLDATATLAEGSALCFARARQQIDRYFNFLDYKALERLDLPSGW